VPEEEFIASHPGPVTIKVTVPPASEKGAQPEWNFDGQTLEFSMDPKYVSSSEVQLNARMRLTRFFSRVH
jgi:hypothetical protein